jgi:hypothetical protein
MLVQPWSLRVTPLPQYWHVITISPNLGAIGAPQLGHFSDVAPDGATTGPEEAVLAGLEAFTVVLFPHLVQNFVSSGS